MKSKLSLLTLSYIVTTSCLGVEIIQRTNMYDARMRQLQSADEKKYAITKALYDKIVNIINENPDQLSFSCMDGQVPAGFVGIFTNPASYQVSQNTSPVLGPKTCYIRHQPSEEPYQYSNGALVGGRGYVLVLISKAMQEIANQYPDAVELRIPQAGTHFTTSDLIAYIQDPSLPAPRMAGARAQIKALYFKF